ncbi:hypothetical protein BJ322DRAFT_1221113 [Thelephora terrestris]|uniref:DUF7704 domain-containing protein n=1 Tax=Thelephora terrestris TaxID=56493 RepID=A0A9P6H5Y0_9AGAM|nr:hypothetical protein BJ322DRAFT_1221113 [Thelephora terrestris]
MPSTKLPRPHKSAVSTFYYVVFGVIEPLLTLASLLEAVLDPEKLINRHGPWKSDFKGAPGVPPVTAREIACQIALAHAVIGLINASVLRAIRRLPSQASQEKIAKSLFLPLAIGDVSYLFEVLYGTGNVRWKFGDWPRINVIVGIGFFIPRVCWLLGIGRYVETRDSRLDRRN